MVTGVVRLNNNFITGRLFFLIICQFCYTFIYSLIRLHECNMIFLSDFLYQISDRYSDTVTSDTCCIQLYHYQPLSFYSTLLYFTLVTLLYFTLVTLLYFTLLYFSYFILLYFSYFTLLYFTLVTLLYFTLVTLLYFTLLYFTLLQLLYFTLLQLLYFTFLYFTLLYFTLLQLLYLRKISYS